MWPAPGFEDTELSVLMEPEVGHGETEVYPRVRMIALHKSQQQSQRRRSSCAFCETSCCLLFMTDIFGYDRAWLRQIVETIYPLLITAVVVAKSAMSLLCPRTST
jgi:hypothetical protein